VELGHAKLGPLTSGLIMYPQGHARCDPTNLLSLLKHKFRLLAGPAVEDTDALVARCTGLAAKTPQQIADLYNFEIRGLPE
jgi:hypothetical protein